MGQAVSVYYSLAFDELDRRRAAVVALKRRGRALTREDVLSLRREVFDDSAVTREEAAALFALERANVGKCPEWTEFFIESITDHVVWQSRPTGVVDAAQAEWLLAETDACRTVAAFAILVNVLAEAQRPPVWFLAAVKARAASVPGVMEILTRFDRPAG